jgi:hypothetical protein
MAGEIANLTTDGPLLQDQYGRGTKAKTRAVGGKDKKKGKSKKGKKKAAPSKRAPAKPSPVQQAMGAVPPSPVGAPPGF